MRAEYVLGLVSDSRLLLHALGTVGRAAQQGTFT